MPIERDRREAHMHLNASFVTWAPRVGGGAIAVFLAMFALDAFDGRPLAETIPAFAIHLVPAAAVGLIVAVAWRFPWIGAAGFAMLATAYAAWAWSRPDWILAISGPLAVTAALFAWSHFSKRAAASRSSR